MKGLKKIDKHGDKIWVLVNFVSMNFTINIMFVFKLKVFSLKFSLFLVILYVNTKNHCFLNDYVGKKNSIVILC